MNDKQPKIEVEEMDETDLLDGIEVEMLLPEINQNKGMIVEEKPECIVKDQELLGLYEELLDMGRKDRGQIDEILANFLDMVLNDGDASSASKEAIVNLVKAKTDVVDKMVKIADLKTRIKLKDKDTFPRYLAQQNSNNVIIESSKRDLLKSLNKLANKKGTLNDQKD